MASTLPWGTVKMTCPHCGQPIETAVPVIFDPADYPDLIERMRKGDLQQVACRLGHAWNLDLPMLIVRFRPDQPLLFSPPRDGDPRRQLDEAKGLLKILQEVPNGSPDGAWPKQGLPHVPRHLLLLALEQGLAAVHRALAAKLDPEDACYATNPEFWFFIGDAKGALYHFRESRDMAALDHAIQAWEYVLNHPNFPSAHQALRAEVLVQAGYACYLRYESHGEPTDLDRTIARWQAVTELTEGSPRHLSNLAAALGRRHDRARDRADLDEAIVLLEKALSLTPTDSSDRTGYLGNLSGALMARSLGGGKPDDLERAIVAARKAVELTPTNSPHQTGYLNNLGLALKERYERTGNFDDLQAAIRAFRKAVKLDTERRPDSLDNLGGALKLRFLRTGSLADLDAAVKAARGAVSRTSAESPDRARILNNLSAILWERQRRRGKPADLEQAIDASRESLHLTPTGSQARVNRLVNLGNALQDLYYRAHDLKDLNQTIAAFQEARELCSPHSPGLPAVLNNLGNALAARYRHAGNRDDLDSAAAVHEEAVERSPGASPERAQFLQNLGEDLQSRYHRDGDSADLKAAAATYRQACRAGLTTAPEEALRSSLNWGEWAIGRGAWEEAAEAGKFGLKASESLFRSQALRAHKEAWLGAIQGLHALAAYALTRCGQLSEAVLALEQGNARLLAEALNQDPEGLETLQRTRPDLAGRYRQLTDRLAILRSREVQEASAFEHLGRQLAAAHRELDSLIGKIRKIDGCQGFLRLPDLNQVRQAARPFPLIYLAFTEVDGLALLIRNKGKIVPVWLDALTHEAILQRLAGSQLRPHPDSYLGCYAKWRQQPQNREALACWIQALEQTTRWLWRTLMEPLLPVLKKHRVRRAALIPQGILGLLPLHAAWTEDSQAPQGRRYALDKICFTYAANGKALLTASKRAAAAATDTILAVADPEESLEFCGEEILAALVHFPSTGQYLLGGEAARRSEVLKRLPEAAVVHLATHGSAGFSRPLESGLVMAHGEKLTLADMFGLHLPKMRLAVLSACETGIPGTHLPDEQVSLPNGLVQAGVPGVVASLWSINDASTMMLMFRFYDAWRKEQLDPAEALHKAQLWLRRGDDAEHRAYFKSYLPELGGTGQAADAAREAYWQLLTRHPDEIPLSHPFHWAAFAYTGI